MPNAATFPPLEAVLQEHFGFTSFRPGQRELIEAVLAGRDALGILPTGGGKSLIYQLPALLLPGLTVVVSPLIALMKDQVDAFNKRGRSKAVALHSNLSASESSQALAQVHQGEAALFYIAPERLDSVSFRERLATLKPRLLVIDEAHCVSQWGHDFRPSYFGLKDVIEALRPCPILALTATATPATRKDMLARLGMQESLVHVASFDRPNLHFEVHPCGPGEKPRRLRRILQDLRGQGSQIVYVGRRKDADEIAAELRQDGLKAVGYHAGMAPLDRKRAQEGWLAGKTPIAVATLAFGMGIDKADVRAVVHYQHPASLEAYYQEAGRAGRDGLPATCTTLFSRKDVALAQFFIRNRYPSREEVLAFWKDLNPAGNRLDDLKLAGGSGLTDEQRNVALLALTEQKWVWKDEAGLFRREQGEPAGRTLDLDSMFARKNADYRRLEEVVAYCEDRACHRARLLRYFGEELAENHRCGNCSACAGGTAQVGRAAALDEATRIYVKHREVLCSRGTLTSRTFAQFLGGSSAKRIPPSWRELSGYGVLSHFHRDELQTLAAKVLVEQQAKEAEQEDSDSGTAQAAHMPPILRTPPIRSAAVLGGGEVFWQSKDRAFSTQELLERKVDRKTGLLILQLIGANEGQFAPSRAVAVLRGGAQGEESRTPELKALPQWAALSSVSYSDLLADLLAMHAKGYLRPAEAKSKRLALAEKGRQALKGGPK